MASWVLSVDTTSRRGGVCLLCEQRVVCELNVDVGLTFSEKLLEMIDFLLGLSQTRLQQLELLAVTTGPGSFTGLRVGIATMKALALRLQKPLIGVPTLEALAASVNDSGVIAPFMDARRGQVFAALYRKTPDGLLELLREAEALSPARWIDSLSERCVKFAGDGAAAYRSLIESAGHAVVPSDSFVARSAALLALRRLTRGDNPPSELVDAFYVRPSDAELVRAGTPQKSNA